MACWASSSGRVNILIGLVGSSGCSSWGMWTPVLNSINGVCDRRNLRNADLSPTPAKTSASRRKRKESIWSPPNSVLLAPPDRLSLTPIIFENISCADDRDAILFLYEYINHKMNNNKPKLQIMLERHGYRMLRCLHRCRCPSYFWWNGREEIERRQPDTIIHSSARSFIHSSIVQHETK